MALPTPPSPEFGSRFRPGRAVSCCLAAVAIAAWTGGAPAQEPVAPQQQSGDDDAIEARVSLPTDRLKERQLDRVRRLIADERWSDAATLLDDMLAGDRDFFFRPQAGQATWRSIKTEAARLVGSLPPDGRAAYDLQFRARAERLLGESIAAGDAAGTVAVARRWFHTAAGRRATLLAALEALDAGQPLAAAAWLERLAAGEGGEFEPTLSVMRATAWWRAGDRKTAVKALEEARVRGGTAVRVGGRQVSLAFQAGGAAAWLESIAGAGSSAAERREAEWWMARGDAARNARVEATRPLLVPRYRVPLTHHPEEARLLEKRRRTFADRDAPLLPAGVPLAVDGAILLHSPLGLLAVDFQTGKRIWLGGNDVPLDPGAGSGDDDGEGGRVDGLPNLERVFTDSTSGAVSSNGRLVYAVESGIRDRGGDDARGGRRGVEPPGGRGGNTLAAYDIQARGPARGTPLWRLPLPQAGGDEAGDLWYLGAPLVVGDQLFVLVEEKGEVRLEVLEASSGRALWAQPLAELDEEQQADRPETFGRRWSGLSPTFSEGVLVCPTGAGTVIAVDLATRTLLWAYTYSIADGGDDAGRQVVRGPLGGMIRGRVIVNGVPVGGQPASPGGWRDACPIVAEGRVLLTPAESEALHCLDLRTGGVRWSVPRGDALYVAGVVDGRAVVVGRHAVDSLSMEDGASAWGSARGFGPAAVSGRGIVTPKRLFLPLDTPEVIEVDLAKGEIVGRSPARGGAVPGNLLAYRGEVISQGIDSLDVFHQVAPLESRIETAANSQPPDPWALMWRGQLELDTGRIADGLRSIAAARGLDPQRIPGELVADALLFGMQRDYAAAAPLWSEISAAAGPLPHSKALLCVAIDNQLASGAFAEAWRACRALIELPPATEGDDDWLIDVGADRALVVSEPRWLQGRIGDLLAGAPPDLRREIDAYLAAEVEAAVRADAADAVGSLTRICTSFAGHPAAEEVRLALLDALAARAAAPNAPREGGRALAVRRELLRLSEATGAEATDGERRGGAFDAWPLGRVSAEGGRRPRPEDALRMPRVIPIPLDPQSQSAVPGLQVGCDMQTSAIVLADGYGRRLGDPIPFESGRTAGLHPLFQPLQAEAAACGPVVVVRSGGALAAFDVQNAEGTPAERRLWLAPDASGLPPELPVFGIRHERANARHKRNGGMPLGMGLRVSEPEIASAKGASRGMVLLPGGLATIADQMLEFRDPVTGGIVWKRHRLPVAGELVGDDEFLCVVPRDGKQASVLAVADGRIVRTCDLPPHHLRLAASGRRFVAIAPAAPAGRVALEWIDPARDERVRIGEFHADARATQAGPGLVAVLEPDGTFTAVDLERGSVRFGTKLPRMLAGLEHLQVIPWQDRLLVIAGRRETPQEQKQLEDHDAVSPLPQMVPGDDASGQAFTGSVWAVSLVDGEPLWPVPATVVRHCLHRHQPAELPVLFFARHLQSRRDGDRSRLSVLVLDKRTGHAVHVDDRISVQPHMFANCEITGDPGERTIALVRGGGDSAEVRLTFTGAPMAPRPPYQAPARPTAGGGFLADLESWIQKAITIPLPF